jgi:hypothetical protein
MTDPDVTAAVVPGAEDTEVTDGTDDEIADAVARFHEDVPHQFQVSLTMSIDTRDDVRAVRDGLNEAVEGRPLTTNDVMRLAMLGAARYHELATGERTELDDLDREQLVPLTGALRRAVATDDRDGSQPDGTVE